MRHQECDQIWKFQPKPRQWLTSSAQARFQALEISNILLGQADGAFQSSPLKMFRQRWPPFLPTSHLPSHLWITLLPDLHIDGGKGSRRRLVTAPFGPLPLWCWEFMMRTWPK